jgi:hypothetical protein
MPVTKNILNEKIFDTEPGQIEGAVVNELAGPVCETRGVDFELRL